MSTSRDSYSQDDYKCKNFMRKKISHKNVFGNFFLKISLGPFSWWMRHLTTLMFLLRIILCRLFIVTYNLPTVTKINIERHILKIKWLQWEIFNSHHSLPLPQVSKFVHKVVMSIIPIDTFAISILAIK